MVNVIIRIVKFYIYIQRTKKESVSIIEVIKFISKYKRIEDIGAKCTKTVNKHIKKWAMYDML